MHSDIGGSAALKYEPSLQMEFRPGFRCCGIANPEGRFACPSCGTPALPSFLRDADQVVLTVPMIARIMLAIGNWLRGLAAKLKRFGQ